MDSTSYENSCWKLLDAVMCRRIRKVRDKQTRCDEDFEGIKDRIALGPISFRIRKERNGLSRIIFLSETIEMKSCLGETVSSSGILSKEGRECKIITASTFVTELTKSDDDAEILNETNLVGCELDDVDDSEVLLLMECKLESSWDEVEGKRSNIKDEDVSSIFSEMEKRYILGDEKDDSKMDGTSRAIIKARICYVLEAVMDEATKALGNRVCAYPNDETLLTDPKTLNCLRVDIRMLGYVRAKGMSGSKVMKMIVEKDISEAEVEFKISKTDETDLLTGLRLEISMEVRLNWEGLMEYSNMNLRSPGKVIASADECRDIQDCVWNDEILVDNIIMADATGDYATANAATVLPIAALAGIKPEESRNEMAQRVWMISFKTIVERISEGTKMFEERMDRVKFVNAMRIWGPLSELCDSENQAAGLLIMIMMIAIIEGDDMKFIDNDKISKDEERAWLEGRGSLNHALWLALTVLEDDRLAKLDYSACPIIIMFNYFKIGVCCLRKVPFSEWLMSCLTMDLNKEEKDVLDAKIFSMCRRLGIALNTEEKAFILTKSTAWSKIASVCMSMRRITTTIEGERNYRILKDGEAIMLLKILIGDEENKMTEEQGVKLMGDVIMKVSERMADLCKTSEQIEYITRDVLGSMQMMVGGVIEMNEIWATMTSDEIDRRCLAIMSVKEEKRKIPETREDDKDWRLIEGRRLLDMEQFRKRLVMSQLEAEKKNLTKISAVSKIMAETGAADVMAESDLASLMQTVSRGKFKTNISDIGEAARLIESLYIDDHTMSKGMAVKIGNTQVLGMTLSETIMKKKFKKQESGSLALAFDFLEGIKITSAIGIHIDKNKIAKTLDNILENKELITRGDRRTVAKAKAVSYIEDAIRSDKGRVVIKELKKTLLSDEYKTDLDVIDARIKMIERAERIAKSITGKTEGRIFERIARAALKIEDMCEDVINEIMEKNEVIADVGRVRRVIYWIAASPITIVEILILLIEKTVNKGWEMFSSWNAWLVEELNKKRNVMIERGSTRETAMQAIIMGTKIANIGLLVSIAKSITSSVTTIRISCQVIRLLLEKLILVTRENREEIAGISNRDVLNILGSGVVSLNEGEIYLLLRSRLPTVDIVKIDMIVEETDVKKKLMMILEAIDSERELGSRERSTLKVIKLRVRWMYMMSIFVANKAKVMAINRLRKLGRIVTDNKVIKKVSGGISNIVLTIYKFIKAKLNRTKKVVVTTKNKIIMVLSKIRAKIQKAHSKVVSIHENVKMKVTKLIEKLREMSEKQKNETEKEKGKMTIIETMDETHKLTKTGITDSISNKVKGMVVRKIMQSKEDNDKEAVDEKITKVKMKKWKGVTSSIEEQAINEQSKRIGMFEALKISNLDALKELKQRDDETKDRLTVEKDGENIIIKPQQNKHGKKKNKDGYWDKLPIRIVDVGNASIMVVNDDNGKITEADIDISTIKFSCKDEWPMKMVIKSEAIIVGGINRKGLRISGYSTLIVTESDERVLLPRHLSCMAIDNDDVNEEDGMIVTNVSNLKTTTKLRRKKILREESEHDNSEKIVGLARIETESDFFELVITESKDWRGKSGVPCVTTTGEFIGVNIQQITVGKKHEICKGFSMIVICKDIDGLSKLIRLDQRVIIESDNDKQLGDQKRRFNKLKTILENMRQALSKGERLVKERLMNEREFEGIKIREREEDETGDIQSEKTSKTLREKRDDLEGERKDRPNDLLSPIKSAESLNNIVNIRDEIINGSLTIAVIEAIRDSMIEERNVFLFCTDRTSYSAVLWLCCLMGIPNRTIKNINAIVSAVKQYKDKPSTVKNRVCIINGTRVLWSMRGMAYMQAGEAGWREKMIMIADDSDKGKCRISSLSRVMCLMFDEVEVIMFDSKIRRDKLMSNKQAIYKRTKIIEGLHCSAPEIILDVENDLTRESKLFNESDMSERAYATMISNEGDIDTLRRTSSMIRLTKSGKELYCINALSIINVSSQLSWSMMTESDKIIINTDERSLTENDDEIRVQTGARLVSDEELVMYEDGYRIGLMMREGLMLAKRSRLTINGKQNLMFSEDERGETMMIKTVSGAIRNEDSDDIIREIEAIRTKSNYRIKDKEIKESKVYKTVCEADCSKFRLTRKEMLSKEIVTEIENNRKIEEVVANKLLKLKLKAIKTVNILRMKVIEIDQRLRAKMRRMRDRITVCLYSAGLSIVRRVEDVINLIKRAIMIKKKTKERPGEESLGAEMNGELYEPYKKGWRDHLSEAIQDASESVAISIIASGINQINDLPEYNNENEYNDFLEAFKMTLFIKIVVRLIGGELEKWMDQINKKIILGGLMLNLWEWIVRKELVIELLGIRIRSNNNLIRTIYEKIETEVNKRMMKSKVGESSKQTKPKLMIRKTMVIIDDGVYDKGHWMINIVNIANLGNHLTRCLKRIIFKMEMKAMFNKIWEMMTMRDYQFRGATGRLDVIPTVGKGKYLTMAIVLSTTCSISYSIAKKQSKADAAVIGVISERKHTADTVNIYINDRETFCWCYRVITLGYGIGTILSGNVTIRMMGHISLIIGLYDWLTKKNSDLGLSFTTSCAVVRAASSGNIWLSVMNAFAACWNRDNNRDYGLNIITITSEIETNKDGKRDKEKIKKLSRMMMTENDKEKRANAILMDKNKSALEACKECLSAMGISVKRQDLLIYREWLIEEREGEKKINLKDIFEKEKRNKTEGGEKLKNITINQCRYIGRCMKVSKDKKEDEPEEDRQKSAMAIDDKLWSGVASDLSTRRYDAAKDTRAAMIFAIAERNDRPAHFNIDRKYFDSAARSIVKLIKKINKGMKMKIEFSCQRADLYLIIKNMNEVATSGIITRQATKKNLGGAYLPGREKRIDATKEMIIDNSTKIAQSIINVFAKRRIEKKKMSKILGEEVVVTRTIQANECDMKLAVMEMYICLDKKLKLSREKHGMAIGINFFIEYSKDDVNSRMKIDVLERRKIRRVALDHSSYDANQRNWSMLACREIRNAMIQNTAGSNEREMTRFCEGVYDELKCRIMMTPYGDVYCMTGQQMTGHASTSSDNSIRAMLYVMTIKQKLDDMGIVIDEDSIKTQGDDTKFNLLLKNNMSDERVTEEIEIAMGAIGQDTSRSKMQIRSWADGVPFLSHETTVCTFRMSDGLNEWSEHHFVPSRARSDIIDMLSSVLRQERGKRQYKRYKDLSLLAAKASSFLIMYVADPIISYLCAVIIYYMFLLMTKAKRIGNKADIKSENLPWLLFQSEIEREYDVDVDKALNMHGIGDNSKGLKVLAWELTESEVENDRGKIRRAADNIEKVFIKSGIVRSKCVEDAIKEIEKDQRDGDVTRIRLKPLRLLLTGGLKLKIRELNKELGYQPLIDLKKIMNAKMERMGIRSAKADLTIMFNNRSKWSEKDERIITEMMTREEIRYEKVGKIVTKEGIIVRLDNKRLSMGQMTDGKRVAVCWDDEVLKLLECDVWNKAVMNKMEQKCDEGIIKLINERGEINYDLTMCRISSLTEEKKKRMTKIKDEEVIDRIKKIYNIIGDERINDGIDWLVMRTSVKERKLINCQNRIKGK